MIICVLVFDRYVRKQKNKKVEYVYKQCSLNTQLMNNVTKCKFNSVFRKKKSSINCSNSNLMSIFSFLITIFKHFTYF